MRTVIICAGHSVTVQEDPTTEAEIVVVVGDFSYLVDTTVREIMHQRLANAGRELILDFSALSSLDSSAASVLIGIRRASRALDKDLIILREMPHAVLKSLRTRGVGLFFALRRAAELRQTPWAALRTPIIPGLEIA